MRRFEDVVLEEDGTFKYTRVSDPLYAKGEKWTVTVHNGETGEVTVHNHVGDGEPSRMKTHARWPLFLIDMACDDPQTSKQIWALQDGYGKPGFMPAQGWDWSGIRDSSDEALAKMTEVALNALFGRED